MNAAIVIEERPVYDCRIPGHDGTELCECFVLLSHPYGMPVSGTLTPNIYEADVGGTSLFSYWGRARDEY